MSSRMDDAATGGTPDSAALEAALRWLATRREGTPLRFLRYAIEDPTSKSALALGCLVEPTASLPVATPESRALAVWGLIVDEIEKLGSAEDSRRRSTLTAAFRLSRVPDGETAWKSTLDDRFRQLIRLPGVFGDPAPTTTTPMHKAWRRAVDKLTDCVVRKMDLLRCDDGQWQNYVEIGWRSVKQPSRARSVGGSSGLGSGHGAPPAGVQPVFLERMVVRVVMHRQMVWRRTTERDVIACEDGVDVYDALASTGWTADLSKLPVKAIWACRLVVRPAAQPGDPTVARLRFRKVLRRGDRYHFVSESWDDHLENWHRWINVDVDHHGIAPGIVDEAGWPVAGLTIQVTFDHHCLPEACWWYTEQADLERLKPPPSGDPRLLPVGDGFVEHTFTEACHPRGSYGIAFEWPQERAEGSPV